MDLLLMDSPLGRLVLAARGDALVRLCLPGTPPPDGVCRETPALAEGRRQLAEYFAGRRRSFQLPLAPRGTPFQLRCWAALEEIPYGRTATYGEIARQVDSPRGFRAVGMACHRNPLPIFIPCHRVVGASGALTGFAAGLDCKAALLRLEAEHLAE
jgi:methylated-DNA-[protein]-cysteine S-methyltransferase